MNIFNKHIIQLRFRIDCDAPKEYMNRWNKLKKNCECGENLYIVSGLLSYCKIQSVKDLPYLNRCEGGIGGDDNSIHKQIRFRSSFVCRLGVDDDIVMDQVDNTDTEKWTLEELDDIIYGFIKYANNYVMAECVNGCIEMTYKNSLSDDYLDSIENYVIKR